MMRDILTGLIRTSDNIYGKQVLAQCQAQINIKPWKGNTLYDPYVRDILKKSVDYFLIWTNLKSDVTCVVEKPPEEQLDPDVLKRVCTDKWCRVKGKRVIVWSRDDKFKRSFISKAGTGHDKQGGVFKDHTFCVKDFGIVWKQKKT